MEPVLIVSTENYKVIQIQKNLEAYENRKPVVKTQDKLESKAEVKTENKEQIKPKTVNDVKAEEKNEVKSEPKKEVKVNPKTEKLNATEISNETLIPTKKP